MSHIDFVAVDWGTSSFRAWAIAPDGAVMAQHQGDQGMNGLAPAEFPPTLEAALAHMGVTARVPVVACGMVGAAQGWIEAPYVAIGDASHLARGAVKAPTGGRDVFVLPGMKQASPPNVMRGEETQIAGFLHSHPGFTGVLCLPGTHTKWVQMVDGRVHNFLTTMTGELFNLISRQSVLRHSMTDKGWDDAIFEEAVQTTLAAPETIATSLFEIRARDLQTGSDQSPARAWLSGLLIGLDLAGTRRLWGGQTVHLIGAPALTRTYALALGCGGVTAQGLDATALTLAGLRAAARQLLGAPV